MADPNRIRGQRTVAAVAAAGRLTERRPLTRAIRVLLTLIVLGFLIGTVASQWGQLREHELSFDAVWLVPAIPILVLLHVLAAGGWEAILSSLGSRLPRARAQSIWAQTLLARYVPGTVLAVVGRVVLSAREGVPPRTTGASLVYEQGLMFVSAVLVSAFVLIGNPPFGTVAQVAILAAGPLLLAAMHPRIFGPLTTAGLRALGREPLPILLSLRRVLVLLGFYLVVWVVFGVGVFLAAKSVFDLGIEDLAAVTAAQALGYTAALATVIFPGGLGVRDGVFAIVMDSILPGGFALAAAIAISVRLITTAAEVLYAAGAITAGRRKGSPPSGMEWPKRGPRVKARQP